MNNNITLKKSSYWVNFFKTPTSKDDLETVLLTMPPFKDLDSKHLKELVKLTHSRIYTAGEYIFLQGDPGVALYIIRDGEVLVTQNTSEEHKIVLAKFGRGDFLGEIALLDDAPRSASAVAVVDTNMAVIFKPDLDEFLERFPKVGINILKGLSRIVAFRLRNLNNDFFNLYNKYFELAEENENGNDKQNISPD